MHLSSLSVLTSVSLAVATLETYGSQNLLLIHWGLFGIVKLARFGMMENDGKWPQMVCDWMVYAWACLVQFVRRDIGAKHEDFLLWQTGWALYRTSVSIRSLTRLECIESLRINIIAAFAVDTIMNMLIAIPASQHQAGNDYIFRLSYGWMRVLW